MRQRLEDAAAWAIHLTIRTTTAVLDTLSRCLCWLD